MNLIVFDMDGTLTDSINVDDRSYLNAVEKVTGLRDLVPEWDSYPHASSSGCFEEIVRRARGHSPTSAEIHAMQVHFLAHLAELATLHGKTTPEIPGAAACVDALVAAGHAVAIASGDWEMTAHHKLRTARIPFERLPSAFCDVSPVRTEIMRAALNRAATHHGRERFDRIVYVGDGPWDVRACREIGWPLVGIGRDAHARRLRHLGVSHVLPDFTDQPAFLAALAEATVPATP